MDIDTAHSVDLLERLLGSHKETIRKLMGVSNCRTRRDLRSLGVDRHDLEAMLSGHDERGNVVWRLRDADLARTFGVSQKRWHYVKRLLLEGVKHSLR